MSPNYRQIAREAVPVKADCYGCDWAHSGADARQKAAEHREETGHATWVECTPKETQ